MSGLFPASVRGVTSEAFADRVADYVRTNPDGILRPAPSSRKVRRFLPLELRSPFFCTSSSPTAALQQVSGCFRGQGQIVVAAFEARVVNSVLHQQN